MMLQPFLPFADVREPFIVAEDERCFVAFKPAGMHSTAEGARSAPENQGEDLARWVKRRMPESTGAFAAAGGVSRAREEAGMLSRLDRDTSGIVLFARDPETFERLLLAGRAGLIRKRYRLLADTSYEPMPGAIPQRRAARFPCTIESRFRSYGPRGAKVACIAPEDADLSNRNLTPGTYSTEVLAVRIPDPNTAQAWEMDVAIASGFRHQIRAHMAWIGMPVRGDALYGGREAERMYLEACGLEYPSADGSVVSVDLYGACGAAG